MKRWKYSLNHELLEARQVMSATCDIPPMTAEATVESRADVSVVTQARQKVQELDVVYEIESNDCHELATKFDLTSGQTVRLIGVSRGFKDTDMFRYSPAEDGALQIEVRSDTEPLPQVTVEDESGRILFQSNSRTRLMHGTMKIEAEKTYYVTVQSVNERNASYAIDVGLYATPGWDDPTDPRMDGVPTIRQRRQFALDGSDRRDQEVRVWRQEQGERGARSRAIDERMRTPRRLPVVARHIDEFLATQSSPLESPSPRASV